MNKKTHITGLGYLVEKQYLHYVFFKIQYENNNLITNKKTKNDWVHKFNYSRLVTTAYLAA